MKAQFHATQKLLAADEPLPFILDPNSQKGIFDSPVLFTGPHNGELIPRALSLDLDLAGTHEHYDLGMAAAFIEIAKIMPKAARLSSVYSPLVANNNRVPGRMVQLYHSEYREHQTPVIMNHGIKNNAEDPRWLQRYNEIYSPYQDAQAQLIEAIKQKFGYAVLFDLHSFAPSWEGKTRSLEIGTLRFSDNKTGMLLDHALSRRAGDTFSSGYPYPDFPNSPTNNGKMIMAAHGIDYNIIEIRHDALQADPTKFAHMITESAAYVEAAIRLERSKAGPRPEQKSFFGENNPVLQTLVY